MTDSELVSLARAAMARAYAPYSGFQVGAALLAESGAVYLGCNIENSSYSPTICAERTAFAKAVSEGERAFIAIAVVGGKEGTCSGFCPPCGVCRQVMMEFCDPGEFRIILAKDEGDYQAYMLAELLPYGFGPGNLKKQTDDNLVD